MKARGFDALRLDVEAFAAEAASLEGDAPLGDFPRLCTSGAAAASGQRVHWSANGNLRKVRVGAPEIWLRLRAKARVPLQCQRCLRAVAIDVAVDRSLRFVAGEEAAAALDADSENDVLALPRVLDLRELVEDEMLLALPLVPMHEACPEPLVAPAADELAEEPPVNPFAVLAALRGAKPGGTA
jgi:uncharacterized protein